MFKSSRNKLGHCAFTLNEPKRLSEIITDCHVSLPFEPIRDHGKKHPEIKKAKALWDTGATSCSITKNLADQLGLKPVGKAQVHHANGVSSQNVYLINIILPNQVGVPYLTATECASTAGTFDIIIGMQLITMGDFAITNQGGKTTVSFRMPSSVTLDFHDGASSAISTPGPILKAQVKPEAKKNIYAGVGRNEQCPCGSGKKYKHCHDK